LISQPNKNSRFPKIILNENDSSIWVSWHSGIGKDMKVEIIKVDKEQLNLTAPMPNHR
jgi:hypothetical protein